jgi:hypothetical protein
LFPHPAHIRNGSPPSSSTTMPPASARRTISSPTTLFYNFKIYINILIHSQRYVEI